MQTFQHVLKRETVLQHNTDCRAHSLVRHPLLPCESLSPIVHPRAPLRRTTMSLTGSTTRTSSAATRLTVSAPAGQGSSATPASMDSAPTSPVGTLVLRGSRAQDRDAPEDTAPAPPSRRPCPPPTCSHLPIFGRKFPRNLNFSWPKYP